MWPLSSWFQPTNQETGESGPETTNGMQDCKSNAVLYNNIQNGVKKKHKGKHV